MCKELLGAGFFSAQPTGLHEWQIEAQTQSNAKGNTCNDSAGDLELGGCKYRNEYPDGNTDNQRTDQYGKQASAQSGPEGW